MRGHLFDRVCRAYGITHKLTKPYHPWTNGQAERMVRTVKDATVRAYHHETHEALAAHVQAFVAAFNFGKHLKRLRWRTPFESVRPLAGRPRRVPHRPAPPHPGTVHLAPRHRLRGVKHVGMRGGLQARETGARERTRAHWVRVGRAVGNG